MACEFCAQAIRMTWRHSVIGVVESSARNFVHVDWTREVWNVDENGNIRNFCRNCFRCNYRSRRIKSKPFASIIWGWKLLTTRIIAHYASLSTTLRMRRPIFARRRPFCSFSASTLNVVKFANIFLTTDVIQSRVSRHPEVHIPRGNVLVSVRPGLMDYLSRLADLITPSRSRYNTTSKKYLL